MAPPTVIPPPEELISFETFSTAMMNAPLDDLYKTYDSDGEHDLEDDNAGEDSDDTDMDDTNLNTGTSQMSDMFDDSDLDIDNDATNSSSPYEYFDARFDINRRNLTPNHSKSHHINPELQSLIDTTELFLEQMSLKFQPMIEEQPMSTTIILANQAVEQVLMPYRKHGSADRLSESAMRFLAAGDTVRRPGREGLDGSKDGKLRFKEDCVSEKENGRVDKLKRKAGDNAVEHDVGASMNGKGNLKIKILKRSDGTSIIIPATPSTSAHPPTPASVLTVPKSNAKGTAPPDDSNVVNTRVGRTFQSSDAMQLDGPEAQAEYLSFRKTSSSLNTITRENSLTESSSSDSLETEKADLGAQSTVSLTLRPHLPRRPTLTINTTAAIPAAQSFFTPLANSFSGVTIKSPTASPSPVSSSATIASVHGPPHTYSCTVDPLANTALACEAYNPLSQNFSWGASIDTGTGTSRKASMPTPGLLDALNNILHLYNAQGRNLLSYYVRKFDTPAEFGGSAALTPTSPGSKSIEHVEPPHALFRLGISQYLHSMVGKMIDSKETDELGLTPEARRVLDSVWEKRPSINAWFDDDLIDPVILPNETDETPKSSQPSSSSFSTTSSVPTTSNTNTNTNMDIDIDTTPASSFRSIDTATVARRHKNLHKFHMGLNPIEKRLLGRACNVGVETVDAYWDSMREDTKAWGAMKLWCEVQTKRRIEAAKREGRW